MLEKLKKFGWLGSLVANLLQLLASYPGLTMSAIAAALTVYWASALDFVQRPIVYAPAGVFLFVLWTFIGVATFNREHQYQY